MKNLSKINSEEGVILSAKEMKEVSGAYAMSADTCIASYPIMCNFESCTRGGIRGRCIKDGIDCYCNTIG